jgi:hypothetical protein
MDAFLATVGLRRLLHRSAGKAPKWSESTVNQDVLNASYAVRGPVLDLATKMEQRLKSGEGLPFDEMVYCNIGTRGRFGSWGRTGGGAGKQTSNGFGHVGCGK